MTWSVRPPTNPAAIDAGTIEAPHRPHMVMVVGNPVQGDSRVEKSAVTAHEAGYRVTVIGLSHRSVPRLGLVGEVPIYRIAPDYDMYRAWRIHHDSAQVEESEKARAGRQRLRHLRILARYRANQSARSPSHRFYLRLARGATKSLTQSLATLEAAATGFERSLVKMRLMWALWLTRSGIPGIWRRTWPLIADLELAFSEAMMELKPDLLHIHDRHALPAAACASRLLARNGQPVRWVYDAHEWLPGVVFTGPAVHAEAWRTAEAEMIAKADVVVTVTESLAELLQRRHGLPDRPRVVANAPLSRRVPVQSKERRTVREECGLDESVPLLVYAGRIAKRRGLETVIQALPELQDVHLAVVAPPDIKPRRELRRAAAECGVSERVHIVDYVPSESVTWYLSTATIGISPVEHNPAHHAAFGTKMREYLHAGLPMISSDVRTQAEFIREAGVGGVHRAGDVTDCTRVISEVLSHLEEHRAAVTPALLAEHSWEAQVETLTSVWGELTGSEAPPRRQPRPAPHVIVGPVVDFDRSRCLLDAICAETAGSGELLSRPTRRFLEGARRMPSDGAELGEKIEEFREISVHTDGLILEGLASPIGGLVGGVGEDLESLKDWVTMAALLDPTFRADPDEIIGSIENSWFATLGAESRERIRRQHRRTSGMLESLDIPLLLTRADPLGMCPDGIWIPSVVPIAATGRVREKTVRVMVAPGQRGGQDANVPARIQALAGRSVSVVNVGSSAEAASSLGHVDVFVDVLGLGTYSHLAARAMGSGCVVLSRSTKSAKEYFSNDYPVVEVEPTEVADVIADLAQDREKLEWLSEQSLAYAREVHGGRRSARAVVEALDLA